MQCPGLAAGLRPSIPIFPIFIFVFGILVRYSWQQQHGMCKQLQRNIVQHICCQEQDPAEGRTAEAELPPADAGCTQQPIHVLQMQQ